MKRFQSALLTLVFAASAAGAAHAAMQGGSSSAARLKPWLGTWSCRASGNNHTATFSPIFGGTAMRISETGAIPSEEIVVFDSKHNQWVDQYADASGMYNTMAGPQSGNTIHFAQLYPAGSGTKLTVSMPSKNTYTTLFSATINGKKIASRETCTRT